MACVKTSTQKSAPKDKRSQRKHIAYARQCKARKQSDIVVRIDIESDSVAAPSTSTSSLVTSALSTSAVQDSVLGNKTRTQFKRESYEAVKCRSDHARASTSALVDSTTDSVTSKRGIIDFSGVDTFVRKLCCP